jgi:ABC-type transport system substrate-binding protein
MRSIRSRVERAARVASAAACLASSACSDDLAAPIPAERAATTADEGAPRRGGTLHLASFGDMRSLDPAVAFDALSATALRLIYAGLVEYDFDGKVVPDLAERFETTDGTTYRFFLRQGVRFHDGEEVTAADVKRSIERALHASTPNAAAGFYDKIAGFGAFNGGGTEHLDGVRVDGRYVVTLQLSEPDATFLSVLALTPLRIVCRGAGDRYADGAVPCGAGPFKIAPGPLDRAWERGRSLTLVRHEAYFRAGLPYLDAVTWAFNANLVTERFKFERGEIDILRELSQPDTMRYQTDPRWLPFGEYEPDSTINGEAMNTEIPPFDNVEVRRAVAAAINRDHIVRLKPSNLRAAGHAIPPSIPLFDASLPGQTYDLGAALEHMRKAGYPYDPATGKGGYPDEIPYVVYRQSLYESTGQLVQQDLARIGLRLDLRISGYATYLAVTRRRGKTPMSPQGWSQDFPDPSDFLEPIFTQAAINDEDSNNPAFYKNAALDALLARAHRELDPAARQRMYQDADRIVTGDAPYAFTCSYRFYDVHQPYVRGYRVHPVWQQAVADTWLDRAGAAIATGEGLFGRGALGSVLTMLGGSATSRRGAR